MPLATKTIRRLRGGEVGLAPEESVGNCEFIKQSIQVEASPNRVQALFGPERKLFIVQTTAACHACQKHRHPCNFPNTVWSEFSSPEQPFDLAEVVSNFVREKLLRNKFPGRVGGIREMVGDSKVIFL